MNVWFMYDNHCFARVGNSSTSREAMEKRAAELFSEDGCGSIFARDTRNHTAAHLHGRLIDGSYGVTPDDLKAFFDRVDEHANWEARG